MTENEKMLAGLEYNACDPDLIWELNEMKDLCWEYNNLRPTLLKERNALLRRMLGRADEDTFINQPFYCDYGRNIRVGRRFFANFSLTILDEAPVTIGDDCFIGPNVSIYTACHSINPVKRNMRREWARPVTIGDNVWIGGSATILPGVTIGNNVTIGAGSVVTKNVPDNEVWAGNPAQKIKDVEKKSGVENNLDDLRRKVIELSKLPMQEVVPFLQSLQGDFLRNYYLLIHGVKVFPIEIEAYYFKAGQFEDTTTHEKPERFGFNTIYTHNHHGHVCFDVCLSHKEAHLSFLIRSARLENEQEAFSPSAVTKTLEEISGKRLDALSGIIFQNDSPRDEEFVMYSKRINLGKTDKYFLNAPLRAVIAKHLQNKEMKGFLKEELAWSVLSKEPEEQRVSVCKDLLGYVIKDLKQ